MRCSVSAYLLGAAMLFGPSLGGAQTTSLTLTPAEMQFTAFGALQGGQPARALALAEALLVRAPDDPIALRIAGQAALKAGQSDVAVRHGRTLYQTTDNPEVRFFAARLVALAHAQQESFTRSQIWLRRARQAAPDATTANAVAQDYAILRQRNPLGFNFNFSVQPSSNINNGSSEDTFDVSLFGTVFPLPLPTSLQNLSGYKLTGSARLRYRLAETPTSFTTATFGLATSHVMLSRESRQRVPDFETSSLTLWRISTGVDHTWAVGAANQPATVSFNQAYTFYDGEVFASEMQLGLARRWRTGERATVSGTVSISQTHYRDSGFSANLWAVGVDWQRVLENGDQFGLSGDVGRSYSDAQRYANSWQTIGASYDFGRVADRFDVAVSGDYTWRAFGSVRADELAQLSMSVGVPDLELYGFTPVVTLDASQNKSTSTRNQTEAIALDLSFRSSF
jgi:hypothetical protein